jgi:hypothetical protein
MEKLLIYDCEIINLVSDKNKPNNPQLKKEGLGNTAIAKKLTGKYQTKQGKTNWSDTQVRRILISRVE